MLYLWIWPYFDGGIYNINNLCNKQGYKGNTMKHEPLRNDLHSPKDLNDKYLCNGAVCLKTTVHTHTCICMCVCTVKWTLGFFTGRLSERAVCQPAGGAARSRTVHPQVVKLSFQGRGVTDTGVVTHVSEQYLQLERPTSDHLQLLFHLNTVHLQEVLCFRIH